MDQSFQKLCYDNHPGYRLHHTAGICAKDSTLPYIHYNTCFMIIYFLQGTGSIKIEGRYYDIAEGDMIILNPEELFCCTVDAQVYHERLVLYVDEIIFHSFPYDCSDFFTPFYQRKNGFGNHIPAQIVSEYHLEEELIHIWKLAKATDTTSAVLSICKIVELLADIKRIVMPLYISAIGNGEHSNGNSMINDILNYINRHYTEDMKVADVSARFGIDASYLSHLFKDHVGISLWNYVIMRRIYLFNDLIKNEYSIEEACYQAGFQNYSNFFRLYKKYMKMTPLQFKKKVHNALNQMTDAQQSDFT